MWLQEGWGLDIMVSVPSVAHHHFLALPPCGPSASLPDPPLWRSDSIPQVHWSFAMYLPLFKYIQ